MRMRTAALVGAWATALGIATAVSWAGVSLVGNEVSPTGSAPLSQAEVERRIHAGPSAAPSSPGSTSGPGATSGSTSSTSAAAGPPIQQSVVVRGGTVVLECTGDRITARTSPRSGYTVTGDSGSHGSAITIIFTGSPHRSQVDGSCRSGTPTASVHETGNEQDD